MVKLSHSVFALPFALMAAFLAGRHLEGRGRPHPGQLGLVVLCMVAARSVAMTFNRIVDCSIDARNPRTAQRPLPSKRLSRAAAWAMFALASLTFGLGCLGFGVFYGNTWPIILSGPLLGYLCGYSFSKRFTCWSHLYLGSAVALSPPAAWLAVHPPSLGFPVLLLTGAVTFWIAGLDIIYACQDIDVDRRDGLHSLPARCGPAAALWIARAFHSLTLIGLLAVGRVSELGGLYFAAVSLTAGLLVLEHWLVRPGDYRRVNLAFFTLNGMISLLLGAAAIVDILSPVRETGG
jgi:4-hydroxybenzoate polyprenyltransferase